MKRLLFFCFIFCLVFVRNVDAQVIIPINQTKYHQELINNLNSEKDEVKFLALCKLSELATVNNANTATSYLNKAVLFIKKAPQYGGISEYYNGLLATKTKSKKEALPFFSKAISLLKLQNDSLSQYYLAHAYYQKAYNAVADKGYDTMVETLTYEVLPIAQKINNTELEAYYITQLGLVFMSVGQFEKAIEYHKKAELLLKSVEKTSSVHLVLYHNFVSAYCYLAEGDIAKTYFDKANQLINGQQKSSYFTQHFYQEAMYYTTKQQTQKALVTLEKGIENAKKFQQTDLLQMLKFRVYNIYLLQKDYVKSKEVLLELVNDKILTKEPLNRKITYQQLARVNEVLGNFKEALDWQKKVTVLTDSIQSANLFEKMNELEVVHQTNEKQKKINFLELEKKQDKLLNKNKQLQISLLLGALILILIITFLLYANFKKQKKLNLEIKRNHEVAIEQIEYKRTYDATVAVLIGEEKERQRIAQDLHDSLGGMLASIRMNLSLNKNDQNQKQILKIDKAITEVRRISRNLMPETLKNLGLEVAMNELCQAMSNHQLEIIFESFKLQNNIPFQKTLAIYRITQEALSNVIKYAQASKVIVQISQNDNVLNLTIEDNGVGFNMQEVKLGQGLKNMKNRAQLMNANLEIVSEIGEGTTINMEAYVK